MNNSDKIKQLEKLLNEREILLSEKEKLLLEIKQQNFEKDEINKHLLNEINELKTEKLLIKPRQIESSKIIEKEIQDDIENNVEKFNQKINSEIEKQKDQISNDKNNYLKELNYLKSENKNLESELNDYIFKNMLIRISINKDILKLNSKYNGYGILISKMDDNFLVEWVNPKYNNLIIRNTLLHKLEIQDTKLIIYPYNKNQEQNLDKVELKFNPDFKIDFEDVGNGINSILDLQKRKRNMKMLERLREYSLFKKDTHDKANKVFNQKNLYFIIPSILITALSGIFSFLSTSSFINSDIAVVFSISVGILASISTFMQSFSGAMDFGGKAEAHSVATEEYDLILTKIKFEINNPNESLKNPIEFFNMIKEKILEIKQKCKYQVPQDIVKSYSSQTVNFELGRIRDDLIREAAALKAEIIKNDIESKHKYQDIELGNIKKEFDFRIIIDDQ